LIDSHTYTVNWVAVGCKYDVLLRMPWHVKNNPDIDYENRCVDLEEGKISADPSEGSAEEDENEVRVTNLSVKKFRQLLKKRKFKKVQVSKVSL